ncbi:hypothetical protein [Streptomyces griseorubiginosus]|uniref:hypothetical protein n=1 Tax=Streptomyces griseorubiginosus TaxID=67304 RepID=UPI0034163CBD
MPSTIVGVVQHQRSGGDRFTGQPGAPEAALRILAHLHEATIGHFHVMAALECSQAFSVGIGQADRCTEPVMLRRVAHMSEGVMH